VTLSRRVLLGTMAATILPSPRGQAQHEPIRIGVPQRPERPLSRLWRPDLGARSTHGGRGLRRNQVFPPSASIAFAV
jgi:hypothetical protein